MKSFTVNESFIGLLYEDGAYIGILEPGRHRFHTPFFTRIERRVRLVDTRERSLTIKGQEILTADKVAIRVSVLVYFRVLDPEAALHRVADYENRIYEDVQLAARRFLASRKLELILRDRNEISDAVKLEVSGSAEGYGVEILRADVKDLVFPGNLRTIMNQVLETERRSEARLIEARKEAEAAKVRSVAEAESRLRRLEAEKEEVRLQAETEQQKLRVALQGELEAAKAVAENPELLKLRQLEVLQKLAANPNGKFVIGLPPTHFHEVTLD
jgi:regulator of protease activity HflC (stomatin/prohibitin superfamily)